MSFERSIERGLGIESRIERDAEDVETLFFLRQKTFAFLDPELVHKVVEILPEGFIDDLGNITRSDVQLLSYFGE